MYAAWVVFYEHGASYSNLDGEPQYAPPLGVVCIRQADPDVGNILIRPADFYGYHLDGTGWHGHDFAGLIDYIYQSGFLILKLGRTIQTDVFIQTVNESAHDPRLPRKSAFKQHEFRQPWMVLK